MRHGAAIRVAAILGGGALAVLGATLAMVPRDAPPPIAPEARRFADAGLSFRYPAGWSAFASGKPMAGRSTIAIVGTQPVPADCLDDERLDVYCYYAEPLVAGAVSVEIGRMTLRRSTIFDLDRDGAVTSWLEVGGMPTLRSDFGGAADADRRAIQLEWLIASPDGPGQLYRLAASAHGAEVARVRTELEALVGSITIDGVDAVTPQEPDPDRIVAQALRPLDDRATALVDDPAATSMYDCFANGLTGGSVLATVGPGGDLGAPMAITCSGTIAPVGALFKRLELEFRFGAGSAEPGARYRLTLHTDDGGDVVSVRSHDVIPRPDSRPAD